MLLVFGVLNTWSWGGRVFHREFSSPADRRVETSIRASAAEKPPEMSRGPRFSRGSPADPDSSPDGVPEITPASTPKFAEITPRSTPDITPRKFKNAHGSETSGTDAEEEEVLASISFSASKNFSLELSEAAERFSPQTTSYYSSGGGEDQLGSFERDAFVALGGPGAAGLAFQPDNAFQPDVVILDADTMGDFGVAIRRHLDLYSEKLPVVLALTNHARQFEITRKSWLGGARAAGEEDLLDSCAEENGQGALTGALSRTISAGLGRSYSVNV